LLGLQDAEMNRFRATTNDEIERLKNQLKWQVSLIEFVGLLYGEV